MSPKLTPPRLARRIVSPALFFEKMHVSTALRKAISKAMVEFFSTSQR